MALALLAVAVGLGLLRAVPEIGVRVIVTLFFLQLVAWMLAPLVAFGVDETVDPGRFTLLPLRPQTLQRGLLVTSLIGYLPAANAVILLGAAVGLSSTWAVLPVALLAAAAQLVLCVVVSRAAATSMAALMSSRRGRDLGMLVGFLLFVVYFGLSALLNTGGEQQVAAGAAAIADALAWTPPGALAALPGLVAGGDWPRAAASVIIAAAALWLAWWWWGAALRRRLVTVTSISESSAPVSRGAGSTAVATGVLGTARVVGDRDRVLMWRDPMRRMPWLFVLLLAIGWPFIVASGPAAVYAVVLGALLVGTQAANAYAIEGSGLWLHLMTITDRARARGELVGHVLAALVPGVVVVVIALAVQVVVRDAWDDAPAALGICLAATLGTAAAACFQSAALPYAIPQSRTSAFASSVAGQKGQSFAATLTVILGGVPVALPAAALAWLRASTGDPLWGWLAVAVGVACGLAALAWAVPYAANRYLERGPELLRIVSAGDRA